MARSADQWLKVFQQSWRSWIRTCGHGNEDWELISAALIAWAIWAAQPTSRSWVLGVAILSVGLWLKLLVHRDRSRRMVAQLIVAVGVFVVSRQVWPAAIAVLGFVVCAGGIASWPEVPSISGFFRSCVRNTIDGVAALGKSDGWSLLLLIVGGGILAFPAFDLGSGLFVRIFLAIVPLAVVGIAIFQYVRHGRNRTVSRHG